MSLYLINTFDFGFGMQPLFRQIIPIPRDIFIRLNLIKRKGGKEKEI